MLSCLLGPPHAPPLRYLCICCALCPAWPPFSLCFLVKIPIPPFKDQLICHLLLEDFPFSSLPSPNPTCGSSSCLHLLWLLSLISVIAGGPVSPLRLERRAGAGRDSPLGLGVAQPMAGHSECGAPGGAICKWPGPGMPESLAQGREAVGTPGECLWTLPPSRGAECPG